MSPPHRTRPVSAAGSRAPCSPAPSSTSALTSPSRTPSPPPSLTYTRREKKLLLRRAAAASTTTMIFGPAPATPAPAAAPPRVLGPGAHVSAVRSTIQRGPLALDEPALEEGVSALVALSPSSPRCEKGKGKGKGKKAGPGKRERVEEEEKRRARAFEWWNQLRAVCGASGWGFWEKYGAVIKEIRVALEKGKGKEMVELVRRVAEAVEWQPDLVEAFGTFLPRTEAVLEVLRECGDRAGARIRGLGGV